MAISLDNILKWWKTNLRPTEAQARATFESFRHKNDRIPIADVDGVDGLIAQKADNDRLSSHINDGTKHLNGSKTGQFENNGDGLTIDDGTGLQVPDKYVKESQLDMLAVNNISGLEVALESKLNKQFSNTYDASDEVVNVDAEGNSTKVSKSNLLNGVSERIDIKSDTKVDLISPDTFLAGKGAGPQTNGFLLRPFSAKFIGNGSGNALRYSPNFNDDAFVNIQHPNDFANKRYVDSTITIPEQTHLKKELYLFIHQSNVVGRNNGEIDINTVDRPDPRIKEPSLGINWDGYYWAAPVGENAIARLPIQNTNAVNGSVSMCMSFAKQRLRLNDGIEEITYINTGIGGTGYVNGVWNVGDVGYNITINRAKEFLYKNPDYRLAGILAHGGETDAVPTASLAFESNIISMINGFRKDFGYTVPFVVGTMVSTWIGNDVDRLRVDAVHRNISNLVPVAGVVDLSDLSTPADLTDELHYNGKSLREAGKRYADVLQELFIDPEYELPIKTQIANADNNWLGVHNPNIVVDPIRGDVIDGGINGYNTSMLFNGKASTKMAWIKPNNGVPPGFGNIISGLSNSTFDFSKCHYFGMRGYGQTNDSNDTRVNNPNLVTPLFNLGNNWAHVAITFDGSNYKVYLNGLEVSDESFGNNFIIETGIIQLGNFGDISATNTSFDLSFDDIKIYPFALRSEDVLAESSN